MVPVGIEVTLLPGLAPCAESLADVLLDGLLDLRNAENEAGILGRQIGGDLGDIVEGRLVVGVVWVVEGAEVFGVDRPSGLSPGLLTLRLRSFQARLQIDDLT